MKWKSFGVPFIEISLLAQKVDDRLVTLERDILMEIQIGPMSTFRKRLEEVFTKARVDAQKLIFEEDK